MSTPWFFLSYASLRKKHDDQVKEFCSDLAEELVAAASIKEDPSVVGFCAPDMLRGTNWPDELAKKLATCRVLVCLYSDAYFKSVPCGKEFYIFRSRIERYVIDNPGLQRPRVIVPVLWMEPKNFPSSLPQAAQDIHYEHTGWDSVKKAGGVRYLQLQDKNDYDSYVINLARTIRSAGEDDALDKCEKVPDFHEAFNAWIDPPAAPTGLEAEPSPPRQVSLTWTNNATNEDGFVLERSRETDPPDFRQIKPLAAGSMGCSDTVVPGRIYRYRLHAFNGGGRSDYAEATNVEIPGAAPPLRPLPPSNVSAKAVSAHEIQVSWQDNSNGVAGVKIKRRRDGEENVSTILIDSGGTKYNDQGLKPATTYVYRICASEDNFDSDYTKEVPAKTRRSWLHLLALIGSTVGVMIILGTMAFMFRCQINPTLCAEPTPTPTPTPTPVPPPTPIPTPFVDQFERATDSTQKWAEARHWLVPTQWGLEADNPDSGWLVVKGTEPGAVKEMKLPDLITTFAVEFVKGNKVGWQIHVSTKEQRVSGGYCFLLERNPKEKDHLDFSAYDCESGKKIKSSVSTGITQYGRGKGDYVQVEALSQKGAFEFYFMLKNDAADQRVNIGQCYSSTVPGKSDLHTEGSVALFGEDKNTEFKVRSFAVYPLTKEHLSKLECPEN